MGINISVHRYVDGKWERGGTSWWDSSRCVGDRQFAAWDFERDYRDGADPYDYADWRPRDIAAVRARIVASDEIPEGPNKNRLLELMDRLEEDPHLWICIC